MVLVMVMVRVMGLGWPPCLGGRECETVGAECAKQGVERQGRPLAVRVRKQTQCLGHCEVPEPRLKERASLGMVRNGAYGSGWVYQIDY